MSNPQPIPSAPPAYASVDPNTVPPSYNPSAIPNNAAVDPFHSQASNPVYHAKPFTQFTPNAQPNAYNQGNMYGAGPSAYDFEGQNVPPQTYNHQANQPLITSNVNPVQVSAISSGDHEPYHRRSDWDSSDQCKKLILYGACFWCIAIILLCVGSVMFHDNLKFQRESQESRCTITSYNALSCTYECHCYTGHDDKRHCDTCWGYQYEYYVTSDACGGGVLNQRSYDDNGGCPQTFKPVGYSNKCWVVCDKSQFSFSSPSQMIAWSVVLLILGGCCCFCGSGFSCKYACCRD